MGIQMRIQNMCVMTILNFRKYLKIHINILYKNKIENCADKSVATYTALQM